MKTKKNTKLKVSKKQHEEHIMLLRLLLELYFLSHTFFHYQSTNFEPRLDNVLHDLI